VEYSPRSRYREPRLRRSQPCFSGRGGRSRDRLTRAPRRSVSWSALCVPDPGRPPGHEAPAANRRRVSSRGRTRVRRDAIFRLPVRAGIDALAACARALLRDSGSRVLRITHNCREEAAAAQTHVRGGRIASGEASDSQPRHADDADGHWGPPAVESSTSACPGCAGAAMPCFCSLAAGEYFEMVLNESASSFNSLNPRPPPSSLSLRPLNLFSMKRATAPYTG